MDSLQQVVAELKKVNEVAILSHVLPDGDCIGSMLALGRALRKLGKKVTMLNRDQMPGYLRFLADSELVQEELNGQDWPEVTVCVDCSDRWRVGDRLAEAISDKRIINIDHHISNTHFGSVNLIVPEAAATAQIVTQVVDALGVAWDKELATQVYTALATDTGSFQYSTTSGDVHRLAARLLDYGLDAGEINRNIYECKPLSAIQLISSALSSLTLSSDGQIAWLTLPRSVLNELGASDDQTEGIVNYGRSIDSVEIAMLFREMAAGQVKVSFRSKSHADVNKLAALFGGGGHNRAAGCTIEGELSEVVAEVVTKAENFLRV